MLKERRHAVPAVRVTRFVGRRLLINLLVAAIAVSAVGLAMFALMRPD